MNKLSERITIIIDFLIEKVNSMQESPQDCITYTSSISQLYPILNQVARLEDNIEYYCIKNDKLHLLKWQCTFNNCEDSSDQMNNYNNEYNNDESDSDYIDEDNNKENLEKDTLKFKNIDKNYNEIKFNNDQKIINKYLNFIILLEEELKIHKYLEDKLNTKTDDSE